MKNLYKINYIFFILPAWMVLFSCGQSTRKMIRNFEPGRMTNAQHESKNLSYSIPVPIENDTSTLIKFRELNVVLCNMTVYDADNALEKQQKDTVVLYEDLGSSSDRGRISIETDQLTDISIEQRYETSVSISYEGPHCDMIDWKHYTSGWKPLKKGKEDTYLIYSYSEKESIRFPKVSQDELKEAVKVHCDEKWEDFLKQIKSPNEAPCSVGISRIFFKITGKDRSSGEFITKLIIIEVPMGC